MPPPANLLHADVHWPKVENAVGLTYPSSFKEYVATYGACVWFDNFSPFYDLGLSDANLVEFVKRIKKKLKWLVDNIYDERFNQLDIPLYPSEGGLFPFAIDYSSNLFCWRTEHSDPDKWPIVCWLTGKKKGSGLFVSRSSAWPEGAFEAAREKGSGLNGTAI
jgi:hypothetical protein